MSGRIRKVKRHKHVTLSPFGQVPIKDAKDDAQVRLSAKHVMRGNKNEPTACAIALAIRDQPKNFPGNVLGAWVFKSHTLIATTIGGRVQARRYSHSLALNKSINGFDSASAEALKTGDVVVLSAPKGARRLGHGNGTTGGHDVKKPRKKLACWKRGVFNDPIYAAQARALEKRVGSSVIE